MSRQTENRPGAETGTVKKIQQDAGASTSVPPTVPVTAQFMAVRTVMTRPDGFRSVRFHKTVSPAETLARNVGALNAAAVMTSLVHLTKCRTSDAGAFVVQAETKNRRSRTTIFTTADAALKKVERTRRRGLQAHMIPCWVSATPLGGAR